MLFCLGIPTMHSTGQQWGERYHRPALRILLFLLMVVAAMTLKPRLVEAITHPEDIQALKEVKLALNASSLMNSTCVGSWDFAFDPCDSSSSTYFSCGVDCSAPISHISRVTGLRLEPNAGYTGPLSPAIGNLTALQQLTISENAFHGHIPATLGNCRHLLHLDLSMNSFSGRLPESLSLLTSLTFLSVAFNSLQGPISNSFNRLKNLTYMYVDNNDFTGNIPPLTGMSSLLYLDASNNSFTGALPALPTTISLLVLRTNHLTGHLPPSLKNLTLLQVLDLRENHLTGTISSFLYTLPNLQTLNLSQNEFTAMEDFRASPEEKSVLLAVDLSFNRIVGTLPASLATMARLKVLALQSNLFTGGIPYSYALKAASLIPGGEQLGKLYLDDNYLSGNIPRPLLNLSADGFNANLVRNCLLSCPASLFFCKGGAQKSPGECKVPVVLLG